MWSPIPSQQVFYNNISLPYCGNSNLSPKPPTEPATNPEICQSTLCDIAAKKPRRSDSPNLPPINPNLPCPSGKVDPAKGTCVPDLDKLPRLFINELFPCRPGDPNRDEFVELRLYPFTMVQKLDSYKLVAFTAYTYKLLLVINIFNRPTINSGFILFNEPMDPSIHVPKDRTKYNNFQILPCSTDEPIVLLLLKMPSNKITGWNDIKLAGQRSKGRGLTPKLLTRRPGSNVINLLDVFKETVIDGIMYGIPINTAVNQEIKDLINADKNNCNFILPVTNNDIENTITLSLNACPSVDPVSFDGEHFKLGHQTPGSTNDCNSQTQFQLQELEQPRSLQNEVGVTRQSESLLDCPAYKEKLHPRIAEIDSLINYEINFIRQKLDPSYECKYYPIQNFKNDVWPKLINSDFDKHHPDFPEDFSPYEIAPQNTRNTPQLTDHWRCAVCHRRFLMCPHSFHSESLADMFIKATGRAIPTQTKAKQRYLMEHSNRRTHYTSVLYFVRQDRRRLTADAKQKYRSPEQEEVRKLANAFLVSFTLVKTNTALSSTTTWYKTLNKLEANIGSGIVLQGSKAARSMIRYISMEGFSNIQNYLVDKSYPFSLILGNALYSNLFDEVTASF